MTTESEGVGSKDVEFQNVCSLFDAGKEGGESSGSQMVPVAYVIRTFGRSVSEMESEEAKLKYCEVDTNIRFSTSLPSARACWAASVTSQVYQPVEVLTAVTSIGVIDWV
ncbi:MAG: Uncharacterised protein [Methanobacteriota archaeon]|nr:MAG: Uncharacterised protein [Euryarchaeota archaeon]